MNKNTSIIILATLLPISGCQLANSAKALAGSGGAGAYSCEQIRSSFAAYDADRQSVSAYKELATTTGYSTSGVTTQTVDTYYEKAKNHANLALMIQGCPPL